MVSKKNQNLRVALIYREAFQTNMFDFVITNINLLEGDWINYLKNVIDDDENRLNSICTAIDGDESFRLLAEYMIQKNDIVKYKKLILIWKKIDNGRALQFEEAMQRNIDNKGLSAGNKAKGVDPKDLKIFSPS